MGSSTRSCRSGSSRAAIDDEYVSVSRLLMTVAKIRVPRRAVETVTLAPSLGRSRLNLVGRGAVLASIRLPTRTARRFQEFLLRELAPAAPGPLSPDGQWWWDGAAWQPVRS
jgi:hypothetical protein